MRVHTVVFASALGMVASSALAWSFAPIGVREAEAAEAVSANASASEAETTNKLAVAAPEDAEPEIASSFEVDGTLRLSGRLGHETVVANRGDETYLQVTLQAPTEDIGASVTPADVTIVVDRSGSMRGSRMDTALAAARTMVSSLRDGDTVSVVAYSNDAEVVVPPTRLDARTRSQVIRDVFDIRAAGSTCLQCGVTEALALAPRTFDANRRVLLLSDGKANRGAQTVSEFARISESARQLETAVTSIGVGIDYDERLLESISRATNGAHHFVERLNQLQPIFEEELRSLEKTVASAASVEVTLAPGVQLLEVLERQSTLDGNRVIVPVGSVAVGEEKTILLHVRMPVREEGIRTVGDVALSYTDATTGRLERADGSLQVAFADARTELDPTVEASIEQFETVREIRAINDLIADGRDRDALDRARRGRARVKKKRKSTLSRSDTFLPGASRSFDKQQQAFDFAETNAAEVAAAPEPAAPQRRKEATKRNAAQLNPFF